MKTTIRILIIAIFLILPLTGISQVSYQIKTHEITIDGTSNLQSWSADVKDVNGSFELTLEDGKIVGIDKVDLSIDATSIEGSEGRRMNKKIYESLKTSSHPNVKYELRDILSLYENPGTARITALGVLTIAGVSRIIEIKPVGRVLPNGDIEFKGTETIDMTNYNIDPPTAMFGVLRTGDEVEVTYRVVANAE